MVNEIITKILKLIDLYSDSCTSIFFLIGLGEAGPSKEATERLKKLIIPCSTLTFDDVQSGEEDTIVKSNEILKILKSENLI